MAVNQSFVNTLRDNIKSELYKVSDSFVIKANNGIYDEKHLKDVSRLELLYNILENYDVTETYFSESYVLKIQIEYKNYCGYKSEASTTQVGGSIIVTPSTYNKETIHEYSVVSNRTTDNSATGITLPKTPQLSLDVYIDGWSMMIGDGSKTKDIYFSSDGGSTAKTIITLESGDQMFYNAILVGTSLLTTANIRFEIL